jgi:hypothetical protein
VLAGEAFILEEAVVRKRTQINDNDSRGFLRPSRHPDGEPGANDKPLLIRAYYHEKTPGFAGGPQESDNSGIR